MELEKPNEDENLSKILSVYFLIFIVRFDITESHPLYPTIVFFISKAFNFFAWPAIIVILLNKLNISTVGYSLEFVFLFWASIITLFHFLKNDQLL